MISQSKASFYEHLNAELQFAFRRRPLESDLCNAYNTILHTHTYTISHEGPPRMRFAAYLWWPLGNLDDQPITHLKFTVNDVEFETVSTIPAFTRFFKDRKREMPDILLDIMMIKSLKTDMAWTSQEA